MKRVYDEKKLIREIKRNMKGTLFWQRKDGVEYISNGIWVVAADGYPIKIRALLFETFERLIEENQSVSIRFGNINETTKIKLSEIHDPTKQTETGKVLNLFSHSDRDLVQLIKVGDQVAGVYKAYMDLVDERQKDFVAGKTDIDPIYFGEDRNFIICTVRHVPGWKEFLEKEIGPQF